MSVSAIYDIIREYDAIGVIDDGRDDMTNLGWNGSLTFSETVTNGQFLVYYRRSENQKMTMNKPVSIGVESELLQISLEMTIWTTQLGR